MLKIILTNRLMTHKRKSRLLNHTRCVRLTHTMFLKISVYSV